MLCDEMNKINTHVDLLNKMSVLCQFKLDYHVLSHAVIYCKFLTIHHAKGCIEGTMLTYPDSQRISLSICFPNRLQVPKNKAHAPLILYR